MYKIGLYEKEITPLFGNSLCGYFNTRLTDGVIDKTFAKSVVIEDDAKTVAILAVDACFVSDELVNYVCKKVNKYTGIARENVTVSATHSHTAGPCNLGELGADDKLDGLYLEWLYNACADTIILAYQSRENAKIKLAEGEVNGISFCRNYVLKSGTVRTNPGVGNPDIVEPFGQSDPYLPVLLFENESGKKLGLLYSFANHQDSVDGTKASGDWSSIVSYRMKDAFGRDFISVMVYGTAGNINQVDVNNKDKDYNPISCHKYLGNAVADGIFKALENVAELDGQISVAFTTKLYENRVMSQEEIKEQQAVLDRTPLPDDMKLDASSPKELFDACTARRALIHTMTETKYYKVTFQIIKIGKVMIFALPGEVFSQFGFKIKSAFKDNVCVFDCLANNRWSYMPTEECYLPELYESLYGSSKYKAKDVTDIFDTFIELGKKM